MFKHHIVEIELKRDTRKNRLIAGVFKTHPSVYDDTERVARTYVRI